MSHGIRVSKDGYDATTASISGLAMHEAVNLLKVKTSAKVTIAHGNSETIAHGLDYTPIVWVFLKDGDNLVPVYFDTADTNAYVDGTNLVIANAEGATRDFYYYIFYDKL